MFKLIVEAESSWDEKVDDVGCFLLMVCLDCFIVIVESFENDPNGDDVVWLLTSCVLLILFTFFVEYSSVLSDIRL